MVDAELALSPVFSDTSKSVLLSCARVKLCPGTGTEAADTVSWDQSNVVFSVCFRSIEQEEIYD